MKKILFLIICIFIVPETLLAQAISSSEATSGFNGQIPQEKMFVHYNSSLLFSGEYLYYKAYTVTSEKEKPSRLSKIAYIELVAEDGSTVFKHQLKLKNGLGKGDFFVPTTVPSGTYKLLGYTNWMRNSGNFFAGDIVIINPYQGDQTNLSGSSKTAESEMPSGSMLSSEKVFPEEAQKEIQLRTNKVRFGTRDQVLLSLSGDVSGTYSVSVRKKDSIRIPQKVSAVTYNELFQKNQSPEDSIYLPELRGKLISGKLIPSSSEGENPAGKKIAFSIPGENYIFKIATTDEKGRFYLNLDEEFSTSEAIMQVIDEARKDLNIILDTEPEVDHSGLSFNDFRITPAMKNWILDRSVYNQIENAYYSVKPDTLKVQQEIKPFYHKTPERYNLDDYTRFATIKETFVEIIMYSYLSRDKEGNSILVVRQPDGATNYNLPTLLLVDGLMVQDHSKFLEYPAKKVRSIAILRDNIFLGSHIFAGVIDVKTMEGDFWNTIPIEDAQKINITLLEPQKLYFHQTYSDNDATSARVPDFRTQLLWEPDVNFREEETVLEFYTSDIIGDFEIELQGFTENGKPVTVKRTITVENENLK